MRQYLLPDLPPILKVIRTATPTSKMLGMEEWTVQTLENQEPTNDAEGRTGTTNDNTIGILSEAVLVCENTKGERELVGIGFITETMEPDDSRWILYTFTILHEGKEILLITPLSMSNVTTLTKVRHVLANLWKTTSLETIPHTSTLDRDHNLTNGVFIRISTETIRKGSDDEVSTVRNGPQNTLTEEQTEIGLGEDAYHYAWACSDYDLGGELE